MNIPSASSFQRFNETDAPLFEKLINQPLLFQKQRIFLEKKLDFLLTSLKINIRQGS
ncbi:hypothetical protein JG559_04400 [Enterococcus faecalis]|uniref:Uncharacterized protein n=1 Tax=Enterococcus faecalis TaxID=1351 RepID=A0A974NYS8_ENTFL|nr:hypothetical protein JG559_04400 [Enterococcus faecalis]